MNKVKALKFMSPKLYSNRTTTNISINEHIKIRLFEHNFIAFSSVFLFVIQTTTNMNQPPPPKNNKPITLLSRATISMYFNARSSNKYSFNIKSS